MNTVYRHLCIVSMLVISCLLSAADWTAPSGYTVVKSSASLSVDDVVVLINSDKSDGISGWDGSNDATLSTIKSEWKQFKVAAIKANGTIVLKDVKADLSVAVEANAAGTQYYYKYASVGAQLTIEGNGIINYNDARLTSNSGNVHFYRSGSGTPFYICKPDVVTPETPTYYKLSQNPIYINVSAREAADFGYTSKLTLTIQNLSAGTYTKMSIDNSGSDNFALDFYNESKVSNDYEKIPRYNYGGTEYFNFYLGYLAYSAGNYTATLNVVALDDNWDEIAGTAISVPIYFNVIHECNGSRTLSFASSDITKTIGDASFKNNYTLSAGSGSAEWESGDESVATVDASGNVTLVGVGETRIYVNVADDGTYCEKGAYYNLTVNAVPCTDNPTVTLSTASAATGDVTATLSGGQITKAGTATTCEIEEYGYVWGTTDNPTTSNNKVKMGESIALNTGFGSYNLTGLGQQTTYHVRAYATNGHGTAYSEDRTFTTDRTKVWKDYILACSDITLVYEDGGTAPLMITSANGQTVKAERRLKLNVTGALPNRKVSVTGTDLRFYYNGVLIDNSNPLRTDGSGNVSNAVIEVAYAPTSAGVAPDLRSVTVACDGNMQEFTEKVKVRSLPATFVIAAKVGGTWYALPSDINTKDLPSAMAITVDNTDNPTKALTAPAKAKLDMKSVYSSGVNSRFADYGHKLRFSSQYTDMEDKGLRIMDAALTDSKDGEIKYDATTGASQSAATLWQYYEWTPSTTDLVTYNLYNQEKSRYLSLNKSLKWGGISDANRYTADVRLLPVDEWYEPLAIDVMEWGEDAVAIRYAGAETTAKVGLNNAAATDAAIITIGGDIKKISISGLLTNAGKPLSIKIGSQQAILTTPEIVTSAKNISALGHTATDVVIRSGGKLTVDGTDDKAGNVTVYPGGKLIVPSGKRLTPLSFAMRGGYSFLGTAYSMPEAYIGGTLSIGTQVDFYWYGLRSRYHLLALPRDVNFDDITDETGNGAFSMWIKEYDGSKRVIDPYAKGWVNISGNKLVAYKGYEVAVAPRSEASGRPYGIVHFPLKNMLTSGEERDLNGSPVSYTTVSVTAYGAGNENTAANNKGWNLIGQPYLASFGYGAGNDYNNGKIMTGTLEKEMVDDGNGGQRWTGGYVTTENTEALRYVTVLNDEGTDYNHELLSEYPLKPFMAYFVQIAAGNDLRFTKEGRRNNAPALIGAPLQMRKWEMQIDLLSAAESDHTGLLVGEDYTEQYEINADLEKQFGSANTLKVYTLQDNVSLAWNALSPALAGGSIPVGYRAPSAGTYVFTLPSIGDADELESLYLTDYEEGRTVDLLWVDYEFSTPAGQNDHRFALTAKMRAPQVVTGSTLATDSGWDFRVTGADRRLLIRDVPAGADVYVFSADGKLVRLWKQTDARHLLETPVPAEGIYNVRVVFHGEAKIVKGIVH